MSVASACLITKSWAQNILSKIIYNNNLNFLSWISFFHRSPPPPAHQKIKVVYGKEMGYGGVVLVVWHCTATKSCTLQDQFCFSGSFSTQEGRVSGLIRPCLVLQLAASDDIGCDVMCNVYAVTKNVRFAPWAPSLHIALLCWTPPAQVTHAPT